MLKVQKAIRTKEPDKWFFDYLNEIFCREVFLASEHMRDQLNLIGIGYYPAMIRAFHVSDDKAGHKQINKEVEELFRRRNEIAHQNDR